MLDTEVAVYPHVSFPQRRKQRNGNASSDWGERVESSESSSGFDELAERIEDEMGWIMLAATGVFSSISLEVCFVRILRDISPDLFLYGQVRRVLHAHTYKILNHNFGILHTRPRFFGFKASPFCKSSTLIPSGDFTNAIRPSRGGLKIVMPFSCNSWHNLYMSAVALRLSGIDRDGGAAMCESSQIFV